MKESRTLHLSNSTGTAHKKPGTGRTRYFPVIVLLIFGIVFMWTGCSIGDTNVIDSVKNATLSAHPSKTIGDAFEDFLGAPIWSEFTADSGEHIVQCTGPCSYMDNTVTLTVQFELDDENDTFTIYTMTLNDIPQSLIVQYAILSAVYDDGDE